MSSPRAPEKKPGLMTRLILGIASYFLTVPEAKVETAPLAEKKNNALQENLNLMVADLNQAEWNLRAGDTTEPPRFELKVRKASGLNVGKMVKMLQAVFAANHLPVSHQRIDNKTQNFSVQATLSLSPELAKKINAELLTAFTENKLQLKNNEESREQWVIIKETPPSSHVQVSGLLSPTQTGDDSPSSNINQTLTSSTSSLSSGDDSSSSAAKKTRRQPREKKHHAASAVSRRRSVSPPAEEKIQEPIVWNVQGRTIVYDPMHPERSDVHQVLTSHGQQFLLFKLGPDDFTKEDAYTKMRAIADAPTVPSRQGQQGVIFLGDPPNDLTPIKDMNSRQREKYNVQRDKTGKEFIPTVKMKILGGDGLGNIRAFGYSEKNATNQVLNIVTTVDPNAHESEKRRKGK